MRYPALMVIIALHYTGAILTGATTLGLAVKGVLPMWTIAAGIAAAVGMVSIAEVLKLFMNIEENTRAFRHIGRERSAIGKAVEPPTTNIG